MKTATMKLICVALMALSLAACGGGGGSAGATGAGATGSTGGTGSTAAAASLLGVTIVNGTGASVSSLSGGQTGVVRAKFTDDKGLAIPNAIVKFTASDTTLVQFTPVSASALTDATGVAVANIKPADFTSAGALSISAVATLGSKTATASTNIAIGAAPVLVGTLSISPAQTLPLSAFSTVTVLIPVTSNGQPVSAAPGLTLTSNCVGNGTATLVAGVVNNGVATATYTNKGCTLGTDSITAAIGSSSGTVALQVGTANIGAINFVSSDLSGTALVLRGTGGIGRKESALLTFKVVDQTGAGLVGVDVTFTPTTSTGGLVVSPAKGTTDSNGNVTTSVQSGTIPTPVRVLAQAVRNGATVSGLSDALTISTGLPIQRSMSLSADKYNIEGLNYDGIVSNITIRMADQYGNPVSDGTTVNFVAEGGAVGSSQQGACQTSNGGCTVPLTSQAFKPLNGRVTVLAYAQGIKNFTDLNGNGVYDPGEFNPATDDMGDAFLDTGSLGPTSGVSSAGTLDGNYDPANRDLPFPYGGAGTAFSATGNGAWGITYIRKSAEFIFSGSGAGLIRQVCTTTGCRDWNTSTDGPQFTVAGLAGAGCTAQPLVFRIFDSNNNPMPADSTIAAGDADKISAGTFFPAIVPSSSDIGGTFHQVTLKPDAGCASGSLNIIVTTPKGNGSVFGFKSN